MKKLQMTAVLAAVLCSAGVGVFLTSYAQQEPTVRIAAEKSGGAKLYNQNCVTCHGARAEGRDAGCMKPHPHSRVGIRVGIRVHNHLHTHQKGHELMQGRLCC